MRKFFTKGTVGTGDLRLVWSNSDVADGWKRITRKEALRIANAQLKAVKQCAKWGSIIAKNPNSKPHLMDTFIVPEGYAVLKTGDGDLRLHYILDDGCIVTGTKRPANEKVVAISIDIEHEDSGKEMPECRIVDDFIVELA